MSKKNIKSFPQPNMFLSPKSMYFLFVSLTQLVVKMLHSYFNGIYEINLHYPQILTIFKLHQKLLTVQYCHRVRIIWHIDPWPRWTGQQLARRSLSRC